MKLSLRKLGGLLLFFYLLVTCYTSYSLLYNIFFRFIRGSNQYLRNASKTHYEENLFDLRFGPKPLVLPLRNSPSKWSRDVIVEIWGKAAIGLFLWEHVLRGSLEEKLGGVWSYGSKKVGRFKFRFRTGAGVIPEKAPRDAENLVLVLNGREPSKIDYARMWLDYVSQFPLTLKNVGLVLLGREDCDNDWILPYTTLRGGRVKFVFLVYDSRMIDDETFFQWPLGVATYRSFPKQCVYENQEPSPRSLRMYSCNFLGTVYPNSTRETLIRVLKAAPVEVRRACMIKARAEWVPKETDQTLSQYIRALTESDLTLNPAGKNPECYRHFEAMSCGSIPVVVNATNDSGINKCATTSLRLFRDYHAPFVWLDSWNRLPSLILAENKLTQEEKTLRRQEVVRWYQDFLRTMKKRFVNVVAQKFEV